MARYIALLRGINVGGRNPVSMKALAACLHDAGFEDARTYVQSGNVVLSATGATGPKLETTLEKLLQKQFGIPILVVVRSRTQLAAIIKAAPRDHGSEKLRSDVFFLKQPLTAKQVLAQMPDLRDGVDSVAAGPGVVYFSRVAATATKTRIQKFMAMPVYLQLTSRNWRTTTHLLEMLDER